ncbi:BT_3987 domain-containing protein [Mucilaginibacter sp. Mucisp84]|uniref:BT_3987 domain-containing protein n=1 Tax=Mucilaginibacter sp. Mucisp84 TaxID=3243058 RepID=UPI0039A74B9D
MKKNISFKYLLIAGICSAVAFTGCRKETEADKITTEALNNGISFIGFPDGMEQPHFFDPFTNIKTVDVFALKRDAKSAADLQKDQTITLKSLPAAIDKYNDDNDTQYELLPTSLYTISSTKVTADGSGNLTAKFAPGDFQNYFTIKLNGSKFDLSKKYALAYIITNAGGLTIHAASKDTLFTFFAIKNKYDGEYHSTGTFHHPTAGDRAIDRDKTLTTAGAISVSTEIGDIGGSMTLTVNEATNEVTVSGNVSATQPLLPVPGLTSTYDPATKSFILNYRYLGGGGYRVVEETIKHK